MGKRKKKRRDKIKYRKTKGTIPRPIVFSQTKRGQEAAERRRRRQAAKPKETIESKKPIEPKETIESVAAVDFKKLVQAIYKPENIEREVQSITDKVVQTLVKKLATDKPPEYSVLEPDVEKITKYRTKIISIDEMSGLYDHILGLVQANKDGITPTDIVDDCGHAYGMPRTGPSKSDRKWKMLDEIAHVEKDGKIILQHIE